MVWGEGGDEDRVTMGIVTVTTKEVKDATIFSNYRPRALLNADTKLFC